MSTKQGREDESLPGLVLQWLIDSDSQDIRLLCFLGCVTTEPAVHPWIAWVFYSSEIHWRILYSQSNAMRCSHLRDTAREEEGEYQCRQILYFGTIAMDIYSFVWFRGLDRIDLFELWQDFILRKFSLSFCPTFIIEFVARVACRGFRSKNKSTLF